MTTDESRLSRLETTAERSERDISELRATTAAIFGALTDIKVMIAAREGAHAAMKDNTARNVGWIAMLMAGVSALGQLASAFSVHQK